MAKGVYTRTEKVRANMRIVNKLPSRLRIIMSEEQKEKISKSKKGKFPTPETRLKLSIAKLGNTNNPRLPRSLETRKKISNSLKGEKAPNWKDGISPLNKIIRGSLEHKIWRESVFKRDNYACIWCGTKSGNGKAVILNADHVKPFAHYPELRFAIDNGRTLCISCHKKTDSYAGKGKKEDTTSMEEKLEALNKLNKEAIKII